jgi:hypothetical protein
MRARIVLQASRMAKENGPQSDIPLLLLRDAVV